ncbi:MAG: twin-arginine translocase TatA/TatE family subunit [Alphaproteobacteria bacterium]|nr:twin-arginine translocase TatA/TatE family subunit [Alphaproteobacteria bacterium]
MMGGFAGIWQWVIVLVIVLILFGGRGKIARLMGDVGRGINSFKRGLKSDQESEESDEGPEGAKPALKSEATEEAEPVNKTAGQSKAAEG